MPNVRIYLKGGLPEGATAILVPIEPPVPEGWMLDGMPEDNSGRTRALFVEKPIPITTIICERFAPCQPGDTAFLLETWRILKHYERVDGNELLIEYKDSVRCLIETTLQKEKWNLPFCLPFGLTIVNSFWRSPVTMPNKACRHVWTVGNVQAVQVSGIWNWKIMKG